jgi:hypothetical protein
LESSITQNLVIGLQTNDELPSRFWPQASFFTIGMPG